LASLADFLVREFVVRRVLHSPWRTLDPGLANRLTTVATRSASAVVLLSGQESVTLVSNRAAIACAGSGRRMQQCITRPSS